MIPLGYECENVSILQFVLTQGNRKESSEPRHCGETGVSIQQGILKQFGRDSVVAVLLLASCGSDTSALEDGATWSTSEVPVSMRATTSEYTHSESFGVMRNSHEWRSVTRYTLSADTADGNAGCHVVDWIPGTWSIDGDKLVGRTLHLDHAFGDGAQPAVTLRRDN